MNEKLPTITLVLTGEQSRALARACKFYLAGRQRPSDCPHIMAVAEKALAAIEEVKQLPLKENS